MEDSSTLDMFRELVQFQSFAEPLLRQAAFDTDLSRSARQLARNEVLSSWRKLTVPVCKAVVHNVIRMDIERAIDEASHALTNWVQCSQFQSSADVVWHHTWHGRARAFSSSLRRVEVFMPHMEKSFGPPPPVEERFLLANFGSRSVDTCQIDPRYRDEVRTLSARLRFAATEAKLVITGASDEQVYLAVRDKLVGTLGKTVTEVDRMPVIEIIRCLGKRAPKSKRKPARSKADKTRVSQPIEVIRDNPTISHNALPDGLGVSSLRAKLPHNGNTFRRDGDVWTLVYNGAKSPSCRHLRGMDHIRRLLANCNTPVSSIDLQGGVRSGADPIADGRTMTDLKKRRKELQRIVDSENDPAKIVQAKEELDEIDEHLNAVTGLGGRPRLSGDVGERARVAVKNAIDEAIAAIGEKHPSLGLHLQNTIQTGHECVYRPDQPILWET